MALYEVDGCLLTMEEINQRFKELRDKLVKAQELADKWIASKGGLTTYIRAGENLKKALKGASE